MTSKTSLFLWLIGYAVVWSLLTIFLDPTVPYDAVEALNWANNAQWGSPKNPWLPGAVMKPVMWFSSLQLNVYWYSSHFFAAAVGMLGVWFLAKNLSGSNCLAWLALASLNLSGIINFDIIPYNDNYLLVMLWPWMMLFFVLAITRHASWWLAFALTAGLATMAKYSTLAFVSFIFLSTLLVRPIRVAYRQTPFWIAILVWCVLLAPNVIWLIEHDFASVKWVDSQIDQGINGGAFLSVLSIFYPLLILFGILYFCGFRLAWSTIPWSTKVLVSIYLLPLALIVLWFSFHKGGRLTEWMQPFMVLAPALMVGCLDQTKAHLSKKPVVYLLGFSLLVAVGYSIVMMANISNAGQKFVGIKAFSRDVEKVWNAHYPTKLKYVGGNYLAQWLTVYAPSRPEIITRWSSEDRPNLYNPNVTAEQIARSGALLLGELGQSCDETTFEPAVSDWTDIRITTKEQVSFRSDPSAGPQTVCVALAGPR